MNVLRVGQAVVRGGIPGRMASAWSCNKTQLHSRNSIVWTCTCIRNTNTLTAENILHILSTVIIVIITLICGILAIYYHRKDILCICTPRCFAVVHSSKINHYLIAWVVQPGCPIRYVLIWHLPRLQGAPVPDPWKFHGFNITTGIPVITELVYVLPPISILMQ